MIFVPLKCSLCKNQFHSFRPCSKHANGMQALLLYVNLGKFRHNDVTEKHMREEEREWKGLRERVGWVNYRWSPGCLGNHSHIRHKGISHCKGQVVWRRKNGTIMKTEMNDEWRDSMVSRRILKWQGIFTAPGREQQTPGFLVIFLVEGSQKGAGVGGRSQAVHWPINQHQQDPTAQLWRS